MSFFGSSKSSKSPPPPPSQYQQTPLPMQVPQDVVSGDQYRYALTNFRIAHEKVEEQRAQLEEQERQVAQLRARIAQLEGTSVLPDRAGKGGNTVDDFSIKNAASQLEKMINRWSSDIVRAPPVPLAALCEAILADVGNGPDVPRYEATSMQVQALLRHAISEAISEGIVNCLIVTNSSEANVQLTRIHEHIFARDPTVACVWRRQTFSAAVETFSPEMSLNTLCEQVPELMRVLNNIIPTSGNTQILESAYAFSRMLHGQTSTTGDAFYRAFIPELGSALHPRQVELVKRCLKSERGEPDRVGATIFPGLVKVAKAPSVPGTQPIDSVQNVVRRAQVICECALFSGGTGTPGSSLPGTPAPVLHYQSQSMNGYASPLPNPHMNGYQSPPPDGTYMTGHN
ncbi:hypothetical protein Moror_3911 [Moniliophthora roreri MCA 2997]|uniref:Uncharacterized protein n=2 Tax=Moniliophthora roreri TaxID=221103 RepID=V2YUJ1_MONRO|nr:hypothetical protein Moror_3911 [Moniliophthora roreri MCA 2997]